MTHWKILPVEVLDPVDPVICPDWYRIRFLTFQKFKGLYR